MAYILGIDAGTSNIKAVLFDKTGNEVCTVSRESHTIEHGNCVEQDMRAVWQAVYDCVQELAVKIGGEVAHIKAIGITGQGEGCWLVDENGEPVQNALLWCDGRAVKEVNVLTDEQPQLGALYHKTTGSPPLTGSSMMLLKWMHENRPEILAKAKYVFCCKDWIRYKLTGIPGGELTDFFMSIVDVQTNCAASDLLDALNLTAHKDKIPSISQPDTIVGTITDQLADAWKLPRGIPVIAGAVDTAATALGLGAVHPNDVCVILGTTCACETILEKADCAFGTPGSRYEKHPVPSLYMTLQPTMNGTPNIDWMLKNISETTDFQQIDKLVSAAPVGCGGVIYHPYISAAGERAPFYNPYATAGFFGIRQQTTRQELIRAVYEGISLSIRDCLADVNRNGTIHLAGGGAKSPVWAQMIADVMGMQVVISGGKEFGAKGVALLAGTAVGIYNNCEDAVNQACTFVRTYTPNPVNAKKYDLLYDLYKQIRQTHAELWNLRNSVCQSLNALDS